MVPHATRPQSNRSGFTMAEILVVIVILGMISGVVVVSWKAILPNQRVRSAVRNLSEVLYGTRSEAIAFNREFRIYYDLDNESFSVRTPYLIGGGFALTDDDEDRLWTNENDLLSAGLYIDSVTIDEETYTTGLVFVRFDPLGAGSSHTVVLQSDLFEDNFYTVEVLPLTGEIRFHDGAWQREPAEDKDFD